MKQFLDPWYVTGLVEGEGAFTYCCSRGYLYPRFSIRMGHASADLLKQVREFFGAGRITNCRAIGRTRENCYFAISKPADLRKVINHFTNYPIQSERKHLAFRSWAALVEAKLSVKPRTRQANIQPRLIELAHTLSNHNNRPRGFTLLQLAQE